MSQSIYQVDAFAETLFSGNPAAVCPLDAWLSDTVLQQIALENNLSETAFIVANDDGYDIRWFTPAAEVSLCGHATMAAAYVVVHHLCPGLQQVTFLCADDSLTVDYSNESKLFSMDFPAVQSKPIPLPSCIAAAINQKPLEALDALDLVITLQDEASLHNLQFDPLPVAAMNNRGMVFTAPGDTHDFVSRCFYPKYAVPEDPVTGSAHCILAPYWAQRLGKNELLARQCSFRGGELRCVVSDNRVQLQGKAVLYLQGEINLPTQHS